MAVGPGKDDKETGVTLPMPVKEGEYEPAFCLSRHTATLHMISPRFAGMCSGAGRLSRELSGRKRCLLGNRYDGTELKYCGKDHTLLRENDICLVWDGENALPTTDTVSETPREPLQSIRCRRE